MGTPTITRSAFVITFFSFLNLILAFLLQVLLAAKFGAKTEMDAYLAASTIPQLIMMVLLGSLHLTFVPVFVERQTKQMEEESWKAASIFTNLIFFSLGLIAVIGAGGARVLVSLIAPGFEGGKFELTVTLLRLLLPAMVFSGLSALLSSIHYARRRFVEPSFAPVLNYLVIIGSVILLQPRIGVTSVAIGYTIGGVAQFALLAPIMFGARRYSFDFGFRNETVVKIGKLMLPLVLATTFTKANTLIERLIASSLPEGNISYLGYSYRMTTALVMLATGGISLSLFPMMSGLAAEEKLREFRETVSKAVRVILLIVLPTVGIVLILREPIVGALLERGRFAHGDTVATALALAFYLGAFFSMSLGNVVTFAFYALQDTVSVVKVTLIGACLNLGLAFVLSRSLGYVGLALAFSIAATFNLVVLGHLLRRKIGAIQDRAFVTALFRVLGACFITTVSVYLFHKFALTHLHESAARLGIALLFALGLYAAVCTGLRCEEMGFLLSKVKSKISSLRT